MEGEKIPGLMLHGGRETDHGLAANLHVQGEGCRGGSIRVAKRNVR